MKIEPKVILGWLKDMGLEPVTIPDQQASAHYAVQYPKGNPANHIEILCPNELPRAVVIGTKTSLSPEHSAAFGDLDVDAQQEFLRDLTYELNRDYVEYTLEQDPTSGRPVSFHVTAVRYDDGLTLDSFARTVSSVFKGQIAGVMCVRRHLGTMPPAGGSEFAFRKLGIQ